MTKQELNGILANNIRKQRSRLNMTREQFSEYVGISSTFLAGVENGKKSMSLLTLVNISNILEISTDSLLNDTSSTSNIDNIEKMLEGKPDWFLSYVEHGIRSSIELVDSIIDRANNIGE